MLNFCVPCAGKFIVNLLAQNMQFKLWLIDLKGNAYNT